MSQEQYRKDIEKKHNRRQKHKDRENQKNLKKKELQKEKDIITETTKPRLRHIMLEVSLISPSVVTTGDRQGYTSELTSHFNIMWRTNPKQMNGKRGTWYGFRLAPFAGGGRYKEFHGNYGFSYFGPMIGIGKLDPMPSSVPRTRRGSKPKPPIISGWLWSGGIAGQHRLNGTDPSDEGQVDDEFNEGIGLDVPGIWTEYRHMRVIWGAVATNFIVGVQSGKGKYFIYTGLGFGGWH